VAITKANQADKQEQLKKLHEEIARKQREEKLRQEQLRKKKAEEAL